MSKYTTEVRYLCEVEYGATSSKGFNLIDDIITNAAPKIFNFDFPIFDENYRLPLEKKILRHYYTREICEETVGLWKLRLQDKLNLIMPYYNKLYSSELLEFNPLYDIDYTRQGTKSDEGERTANETENRQSYEEGSDTVSQNSVAESNSTNSSNSFSNTENSTSNENSSNSNNYDNSITSTNTNEQSSNSNTANKVDKYSETPQGAITGLANDTYLTNARMVGDTTNGNTTADASSTGNSISESNSQTSGTENETFTGNTNNSSTSSDSNISSVNDNRTLNSSKNNNSDMSKYKSGTVTNSEEYFERVAGKRGTTSTSKLLKEFRDTFLNIDKMIIDELNDLFFGLW